MEVTCLETQWGIKGDKVGDKDVMHIFTFNVLIFFEDLGNPLLSRDQTGFSCTFKKVCMQS